MRICCTSVRKAKKEQKAAADLERAQAKQAAWVGPGCLEVAFSLREVLEDIKDTTAALEADGSLSTVVKDFPCSSLEALCLAEEVVAVSRLCTILSQEKCAAMDADYEKRSVLAAKSASKNP